ncbi:flippase-like domain-containing protein [Candidatus Micrarchaeota archaeon]|nr:flippase-like domain-containing protein [Candidatus Micrarchaeota archaeon]
MNDIPIKKKDFVLNASISLIIMAVIFYFLGPEKILEEFSSIDYSYLILSIILLLLMYFGMVARMLLIFSKLGISVSFLQVFKIHLMGMLLADFTPARTGYLTTIYAFSKKLDIPMEKATVAVLGPQIYDFMLKVIVGTIGVFFLMKTYLGFGDGWILFAGSFVMSCMIAIMLLLLFSKKFLLLFSRFKSFPIMGKVLMLFEGAQKNSNVIINQFPKLFLLLMFNWITKALSWYFIAKSLSISLDVGFPEVFVYFFLQPILTLLEFMPTPTLAGLGVSEGGGVLLFSILGVGAVKAASFVFLARIKTILVNLPSLPIAISLFSKRGTT